MSNEKNPSDTAAVDPEKPSVARAYDWYLGGSTNTPIDRAFAERILTVLPPAKTMAVDNRNFLRRVVTYLVDAGVRQFIDIGSGIPTVGNVHEVARDLAPDVNVVYVDNDPVAVTQSRLLLRDDPATTVIDADLRYPDAILNHPDTRAVLDFDSPIALLMIAVLHFIPDRDDPAGIIAAYRDALPRGSYLALSHLTDETASPELRRQVRTCIDLYQNSASPLVARTRHTLSQWIDGLTLIPPGVTIANQWNPESLPPSGSDHDLVIAGLAQLPT
ncbi:SAM-dependent methyltransferase [Amycolatopsis australiensis]|uniref:S-adenosyl methyltransferase n=1 Tax=Amycolatopsis australiensis TaxID=546364 RepID=A0A1K1RRZ5_9PSEU|nr:SAM-dependent methyltransferase [Amycolatopsis australiensis]SFW74846.1 S-adenosyl methyltransferase [Amycolatopsis australiensis]